MRWSEVCWNHHEVIQWPHTQQYIKQSAVLNWRLSQQHPATSHTSRNHQPTNWGLFCLWWGHLMSSCTSVYLPCNETDEAKVAQQMMQLSADLMYMITVKIRCTEVKILNLWRGHLVIDLLHGQIMSTDWYIIFNGQSTEKLIPGWKCQLNVLQRMLLALC